MQQSSRTPRRLPEPPDAVELAAAALRHRDRSRQDVDARLERAGVGEDARSEALEKLERLGYVDDTRFATNRAAVLAERGRGDAAIKADLLREGVLPEVAAEALAALEAEHERAERLVTREGRSAKTAARLARWGFSYETIASILPELAASE